VFLLQLVVIGRGLGEDAFELIDTASGVIGLLLSGLGLLLSGLGLLPQLVVAAKQVVEPTLAFTRIIGEM